MFQKIDRAVWNREEYFSHYYSNLPCTYSMTVELDITHVRETRLNLYPTMLYCISTIVNRHEEFRMAISREGEVGVYDMLFPCYTVFHKESETFSNIWTEYSESYVDFCTAYEKDIKKYGAIQRMTAKPNQPEHHFPVSMIPWAAFKGFNLNLQKGFDYLLPIFTMGKFEEKDGRCTMPLAVQVHHAVCDGFHVSRFISELQELLHCI